MFYPNLRHEPECNPARERKRLGRTHPPSAQLFLSPAPWRTLSKAQSPLPP